MDLSSIFRFSDMLEYFPKILSCFPVTLLIDNARSDSGNGKRNHHLIYSLPTSGAQCQTGLAHAKKHIL